MGGGDEEPVVMVVMEGLVDVWGGYIDLCEEFAISCHHRSNIIRISKKNIKSRDMRIKIRNIL